MNLASYLTLSHFYLKFLLITGTTIDFIKSSKKIKEFLSPISIERCSRPSPGQLEEQQTRDLSWWWRLECHAHFVQELQDCTNSYSTSHRTALIIHLWMKTVADLKQTWKNKENWWHWKVSLMASNAIEMYSHCKNYILRFIHPLPFQQPLAFPCSFFSPCGKYTPFCERRSS